MDGDVFTRQVRNTWRRVAEAFRDGVPDVCADHLERAMAKELRLHGGVRALPAPQETGGTQRSLSYLVTAMEGKFRQEVVDRVGPILIGHGRFQTYDDVQSFVDKVTGIANFDSLAGQLLHRPDGTHVRKPPRRHKSSASLLSEAAPLGDRA